MEDLRYDPARNLKKEVIRELRSCRFLSEAHNILISGATGTGKSYLGCALGNLACRHGYRVCYYRLSVFLDAMMAERALGTYAKALEGGPGNRQGPVLTKGLGSVAVTPVGGIRHGSESMGMSDLIMLP